MVKVRHIKSGISHALANLEPREALLRVVLIEENNGSLLFNPVVMKELDKDVIQGTHFLKLGEWLVYI